jgi:hypothetical protein
VDWAAGAFILPMSTLLAEVYGPSSENRRAVAPEMKKIFAQVP